MEELLLDERVDLEVSTRLGQTALFKAVPGTLGKPHPERPNCPILHSSM